MAWSWNLIPEKEVYWQNWKYNLRPAPWSFSGRLTGLYLVTMAGKRVAGDHLTKYLPDQLELDPAAAGPDGKYFVAVGYGRQICVRYAWVPRMFGMNYRELVSGISGVRLKKRPELGTFTHMAGLFVDSLIPLAIGRFLGYPKFMSRIDVSVESSDKDRLKDPLGVPFVKYAVRLPAAGKVRGYFVNQDKEVCPPEGPAFEYYRRFFKQPVVSRNMFGHISMFRFDFHLESAVMQPVSMAVTLDHAIPGLPVGTETFASLRDDAPLGGCRLLMQWNMSSTKKGTPAFSTQPGSSPAAPELGYSEAIGPV